MIECKAVSFIDLNLKILLLLLNLALHTGHSLTIYFSSPTKQGLTETMNRLALQDAAYEDEQFYEGKNSGYFQ